MRAEPVIVATLRAYRHLPLPAKRRLRRLAYTLKLKLGVPSVESTLRRMAASGFAPRVAIDVGAYQGEWTRLCTTVFPAARVLMIEPQPQRAAHLERLAAEIPNISFSPSLLGATERPECDFYVDESVSSVLPEAAKAHQEPIQLSMRTLDGVVTGTPFEHPDLLKLDVQGYELEVLAGGSRALESVQAVLMEVSLIPINEGAPLLADVVATMAGYGFRAYDICTFFRRPYDDALWQVDLMFVRDDSELVADPRWT